MRDYTGIPYASIPPIDAPDFKPRLRNMLGDIDYFLRDLSRGMGRIQNGEIPDGSGRSIPIGPSLVDYFFLPGISGGQIAHGDTNASGNLTLRSTNNTTGGSVIIQGQPTQTADILQIQDSDGVVLTSITSSGDIAGGALTSDSLNLLSNAFNTSVARITLTNTTDVIFDVPAGTVNPLTLSMGLVSGTLSGLALTVNLNDTGGNNSTLRIDNRGGSASPISLQIWRATIGSTANQTEWRDEANAIMSRINSSGAFVGPIVAGATDVTDSTFRILDDATPTKIAQFQCDSLTAGTNTFTFPNTVAGTLAMVDLAQTFTALQTFRDSTFKVVDTGNETKDLIFNLSGAAGVRLTLAWAGTANRTVTFPDASLIVTGFAAPPTANRVPFAASGGNLLTDPDLTFLTDTLSATKVAMSSLTSGRVPFASTAGLLIDDADLTFSVDTLTATKIVGTTSVKVGTAAGYISSDGSTGATGSFTTVDGKTVTVKDGIITSIV